MLKEKSAYQALTWVGAEKIELVSRPMPEVRSGELLVKVLAASICGSDLRIYKYGNDRVSSGAVIGHEICGLVVKVGVNQDRFNVGDIVAIGADIPCDNCRYCKQGRSNSCETHLAVGHQVDGGFAEYIHLDATTVRLGPIVKVDSKKDPGIYALAEPLACCINGFQNMGDVSAAVVAIYGAGPIGMMLARLAKFYGAKKVIVLDLNAKRLDFARKNHFADDTVNLEVENNHFSEEFDIIFTACSSEFAQLHALSRISKGGKINFFGGLPKSKELVQINTNIIHYKEIIITGSHGSTPEQHATAVRLLDEAKIDLGVLLTASFALKNFKEAYELAASGDAMKVVFRPHFESI